MPCSPPAPLSSTRWSRSSKTLGHRARLVHDLVIRPPAFIPGLLPVVRSEPLCWVDLSTERAIDSLHQKLSRITRRAVASYRPSWSKQLLLDNALRLRRFHSMVAAKQRGLVVC